MIMTEEIRQDGKVVLSSDAEHAIPMIFNKWYCQATPNTQYP